MTQIEQRLPLPPFNMETALQKVQMAEDAWNSKDPERVSKAYTIDTEWRNRTDFINGREEVVASVFCNVRCQRNQCIQFCIGRFTLSDFSQLHIGKTIHFTQNQMGALTIYTTIYLTYN